MASHVDPTAPGCAARPDSRLDTEPAPVQRNWLTRAGRYRLLIRELRLTAERREAGREAEIGGEIQVREVVA